MKIETAAEIQRIMEMLRDLEKEKYELRSRVREDDLKELREKLSPRCINLAFDDIMKDINDEINRVKAQLHEFVGGYDYQVKSNAIKVMQEVIRDVFDRWYGDAKVPDDLQIIVKAKIEDAAGRLVSQLR